MKIFKLVLVFIALINNITLTADEQKITLFYNQNCYYCQKVYTFLKKNSLENYIEIVDTNIHENRELLRTISGKTQIPYIVDTDAQIKMAESDDIIEYFIKKYKIQSQAPIPTQPLPPVTEVSAISYNQETFIASLQQSNKPVVVLVSAAWCPPCKKFKPIFLEVAQEFCNQCDFFYVDIDANKFIAQELKIQSIPTIVCYKNKQEIRPEHCRSKNDLVKLITQLLQS